VTAQAGDSFEYEGERFFLLGYTGGELLTARDLGMSFQGGSTADARGFTMVYGIENNTLVVKHIVRAGAEIEPITHNYTVTYIEEYG
jgi:hypothetical protein